MLRWCAFLALTASLFLLFGKPPKAKRSIRRSTEADSTHVESEPAKPVPEYARVGLLLDKKQYFLGENIQVHFFVENVGPECFTISLGGDYRFASRALRFSVTATDAHGRQVPDPDPSGYCMGGLGWNHEVKPGERHIESLPLLRYCRFEKAGVYRLRVSHDFGWRPTKARKLPIAEASITLVEPNPEQARRVVAEMDRLLKDAHHADFSTLAYPVYLPILAPRAAAGDKNALEALGNIPTSEATAALIRLLEHKDAGFALKAMRTLNCRLPDPQLQGKLDRRNPFDNDHESERRWLTERSWRAEFAPAVRKAGRELLLTRADAVSLQCGAFILECLGEKEDLPSLARAIDWAAFRAGEQPLEEKTYPRPRGACQELLRAARMMGLRGVVPPVSPRSSGEMILFAAAVGARPEFRPVGWEKIYARLLQAELPYVREVALCNLPVPPPPALLRLLPALLLDKNVDVQIAACEVAGKVKDPALREPLLRVLASARERWLFYAVNNAAYGLDRLECIRVLVSRLDEKGMAAECLEHLAPMVLSNLSGYSPAAARGLDGAARRACKAVWLRFVREHGEELRAGKRFPLADPALPRKKLFPGFTFDR